MKIGFFGALSLLLITLKLTGVIAVSWAWVLMPLFIGTTLSLVIVGFIVFVAVLCNKDSPQWERYARTAHYIANRYRGKAKEE